MAARMGIISVLSGVIIGVVITSMGAVYHHLWITSRPVLHRPQAALNLPVAINQENQESKKNIKRSFAKPTDVINNLRVICFVVTYPPKHNTSAKSVKETWGRRCTRIVFISSRSEPSLPTVTVDLQEDRNHLWGKTKLGFQHVYKHYYKEGDWFLKADDDTYVVMENLKLVLSQYDPEKPVHLGCQYSKFSPQGYMSGGSGYVLSREAVRRAVEEGFPYKDKCKQADTGAEDADMGRCLYQLGVKSVDSRDALGRYRFFPLRIEAYVHGHIAEYWFWKNIYYPFNEGENCCSDTPISWHYVKPKNMYVLEYLLYKARPYGLPSPIKEVERQVLHDS